MMHKLQHTDSEFLQEWFHSKGCWLDWFGHWPWPVLARRSSTNSSSSNRAAIVMIIKLRFLDFLSFEFFSSFSCFSFCWGCCFSFFNKTYSRIVLGFIMQLLHYTSLVFVLLSCFENAVAIPVGNDAIGASSRKLVSSWKSTSVFRLWDSAKVTRSKTPPPPPSIGQ